MTVVHGGAVPAAVFKLVLALLYGHLGGCCYGYYCAWVLGDQATLLPLEWLKAGGSVERLGRGKQIL